MDIPFYIPLPVALAAIAVLGYLAGRRSRAHAINEADKARRELRRAKVVARELEQIAEGVRKHLATHHLSVARFKDRVAAADDPLSGIVSGRTSLKRALRDLKSIGPSSRSRIRRDQSSRNCWYLLPRLVKRKRNALSRIVSRLISCSMMSSFRRSTIGGIFNAPAKKRS